MSMLLLTGLLLNLVLGLVLLRLWWRLRQASRGLAAEVQGLALAAAAVPPGLSELLAEPGRRVIAIEILNPMELAAKQSWVAGTFGSLSPALIHRLVHDKAAAIVDAQLRARGVEAQVTVHRAR